MVTGNTHVISAHKTHRSRAMATEQDRENLIVVDLFQTTVSLTVKYEYIALPVPLKSWVPENSKIHGIPGLLPVVQCIDTW